MTASRKHRKTRQRKKSSTPSNLDRLTQFLELNRLATLLFLLGIAFCLRLYLLINTHGNFPASMHQWEESDMSFFHDWAKRIKGGDILTDTIYHPFHSWHSMIANAHFASHPEQKTAMERAYGPTANHAHIQMNKWMGDEKFHQEPLYPYLIASIYSLFGSRPFPVFIFQSLLGLLSLLLVFLVSERNFGIVAAAFAGLLTALSGIFMTYEITLLRASLVSFFAILLVYWLQRTMDQSTRQNWILLGVFSALAFLTKFTFILFLFGAAIWFLLAKKYQVTSLKHIGLGFVGFLLAFSPLLVRNALVGAPLVSTNSVGAITAISPNHKENTSGEFWIDGPIYARILEKTNASTFGSLFEAIRSHPSPWSYIGSLLRRADQALRWRVYTDNVNHLYWREHFLSLKIAFVNFWLIAPLALTGILFCFYPKRNKKIWPLLIMTLASMAPLVLFYVLERYRLPFLIVLLPFGGYALQCLLFPVKAKHFLLALGCFLLTFLWTNEVWKTDRKKPVDLIRKVDFVTPFQYHFRPQMDIRTGKKEYGEALDIGMEYRKAIPDHYFAFNANNKPSTSDEREILQYLKLLHTYFSEVADADGDQKRLIEIKRDLERMQLALN